MADKKLSDRSVSSRSEAARERIAQELSCAIRLSENSTPQRKVRGAVVINQFARNSRAFVKIDEEIHHLTINQFGPDSQAYVGSSRGSFYRVTRFVRTVIAAFATRGDKIWRWLLMVHMLEHVREAIERGMPVFG